MVAVVHRLREKALSFHRGLHLWGLGEAKMSQRNHYVKSVQIRSYFLSVFSCIRAEYRKIRTRNNSVFGHFSWSEFDQDKDFPSLHNQRKKI